MYNINHYITLSTNVYHLENHLLRHLNLFINADILSLLNSFTH